MGRPTVAYLETVTQSAEGSGKHVRMARLRGVRSRLPCHHGPSPCARSQPDARYTRRTSLFGRRCRRQHGVPCVAVSRRPPARPAGRGRCPCPEQVRQLHAHRPSLDAAQQVWRTVAGTRAGLSSMASSRGTDTCTPARPRHTDGMSVWEVAHRDVGRCADPLRQ